MSDITPITREEALLDGQDLTPITRKEQFIKRIYDPTQVIPEPATREEWFLKKAGEGSSPVTVEALSVTENGIYSETGKAYSPVTVEVPLGTKSITNNGTYNASSDELAGYSSVIVNVPYDFEKKSLSNQPVASFDDAMNAPLYDLDIDIDPVQDLHGYANPWVGGAGKNKCGTFELGTWMESSNVGTTYNNMKMSNNARFRSANLIPVTFPMTISIADGYQYALIVFDENGGYLGSESLLSFRATTYTQSTAWYGNGSFVAFAVKRNDGADVTSDDIANCHLQIEEGSSATSYAPYANICPISGWTAATVTACGETYNISFGAAGTVYGGTLDVTTGVLTVDRASVDMGSLSYTYYRYGNVDGGYTDGISTDVKKPEPLGATSAISSHLTAVRDVVFDDSSDGKFSINVNGRMKVHWDGVSTGAELQTALSGVQLVYELATPQTYQLTPEEIKTIFDQQNNIYADTGNVNNVTYLAVASE